MRSAFQMGKHFRLSLDNSRDSRNRTLRLRGILGQYQLDGHCINTHLPSHSSDSSRLRHRTQSKPMDLPPRKCPSMELDLYPNQLDLCDQTMARFPVNSEHDTGKNSNNPLGLHRTKSKLLIRAVVCPMVGIHYHSDALPEQASVHDEITSLHSPCVFSHTFLRQSLWAEPAPRRIHVGQPGLSRKFCWHLRHPQRNRAQADPK